MTLNLTRSGQTAGHGTIVFCSLAKEQAWDVQAVAYERGFEFDVFHWVKPDLFAKSNGGGPRQPRATETIVVVYLRSSTGPRDRSLHYVLLDTNEVEETHSAAEEVIRFS